MSLSSSPCGGLQRQAAGDDEAYVENLRIGLALSRSTGDHTLTIDLLIGREIEGVLDWRLGSLVGKASRPTGPDPPRRLPSCRHLDETASEGKDQGAIAALLIKNTLDNPLSLLEQYLGVAGEQAGPNGPGIRDEAVWVALAWLVPWEHARQERIFRVVIEGDQQQQEWLIDRKSDLGPLTDFVSNDRIKNLENMRNLIANPWRLCATRAMQLKLAAPLVSGRQRQAGCESG